MRFFTYELTSGSLTVNQIDGVMFISVQCDAVSGSCQVLGSIGFQNLTSTAVTLTAGQGINVSALSPASTLAGLTITHLAGNVSILIGY
jgi:hypothetical protein